MSAIKVRKMSIKGRWVRCPGRGSGDVPRQLTLFPSGAHVVATCGAMHRDAAKSRGSRAQCMFQVEGLSAQQLGTIAQAEKGKPFRLKLAAGTVEGVLVEIGASSRSSTAAAASAAVAAKSGAAPGAAPRMPGASGAGGAFAAAMGAVAAVAGAAGQIAGAAGQVAGAGASAVGSVSDLGREGIGLARDGVREAGAAGERRHERKMSASGESDGSE